MIVYLARLAVLVVLSLSAATGWTAEIPNVVEVGGAGDGELVNVDSTEGNATGAAIITTDGNDPIGALAGDAPGRIVIEVGGGERQGTSNAVKILLLITVLSVAPAFLMLMTSFTRIIIVLGFVRRALGTQTLPPNQVLLGLSLFLTLFVMAPQFQAINDEALQPYLREEISEQVALDRATNEIRQFMVRHTRKSDLALFINISGGERPESIDDVGFLVLVPAFITSELKTAFQMGFIIFLPFIVIDLVIAAILMALGMMMLPPVMISLPFKVLLFVLVDGWTLLVASLVASYA
ncbi:MAG: flagellar biosynthetic protein FliP [Planctomycetota bacterium]|nr:MAG: flagellar biosynthetic protein FliP [Planctomycetota bacterium]